MTGARRILGSAAVCLALGLLTTVAIAWSSAATLLPDLFRAPLVPLDPGSYGPRFSQRGNVFAGVRVALTYTRTGLGFHEPGREPGPLPPPESIPFTLRWWNTGPDAWPDAESFYSVIHDARGWPYPALRCHWKQRRGAAQTYGSPRDGIELPSWGPPGTILYPVRALPYRVMAKGLAADTAIFGGVWLLVFITPGAIRSHLRRRRNLCTRCGYSRAGLGAGGPCPECGAEAGVSA